MAAFGWMTTKAASVYTETFTVGSNGWHWIPPSTSWQGSITGGYASVTANPFTGFPPVFNRAILSSTNTPVVSGGAFTGDYQVAQIARMGFKYWASNFAYNDALEPTPTQITSKVTLRWGNASNAYYKVFEPSATGVWYTFEADVRCYEEGGWLGSHATNFQATLLNVEFVQIEVEGQGSASFGGKVNTYLIDDIFIDTVTNYTASASSQTITFPSIPDKLTTNVVNLSATSSSGLPVFFSVASGPAVIACCTSVTFTGTGVVSIVASQNGDTNFNAAASVTNTFTVNPAKSPAIVEFSGLSQTYDGTARTVTASTTPEGLDVLITYNGSEIAPVNAGSYAITGTVNDSSYEGLATGTLVVAKAVPTITMSDLAVTYDGTAKCVSVTTVPSNLIVQLTYDGFSSCPTNPGSYEVVGTVSASNHAGAVTNTLEIAKLEATVQLDGLNATYNGGNQCVTATTSPTGLVVNIAYNGLISCPVTAGIYTVVGQIDDPIYSGSSTGTFTINKAIGSVTFYTGTLTNTYNGFEYCAQGQSSPPGRRIIFTYDGETNCPVNAGDYVVVGTLNDANYQAASTNIMTIQKASQTLSFSALPGFVFGDAPYLMSASSDRGLPVTFSSSDPAVATVSGNTLSILGTGTANITASQEGSTNYDAASDVVRAAVVSNLVIELDAQVSGSDILLDITGNPGRTYWLEHSPDLTQSNWQTLVVVTNLPSATYQVTDPATNDLRHYRLKRLIWAP